jgi:hypothetical protein
VKVKLLEVTIYEDDGWTWRTERAPNPTWDDVEAAIRRLDRFRCPFIFLYRTTDPDPDTYCDFNVICGEGEFAMDSMADGTCYRYYDQSRGDDMIEVWGSDQGATFEAKYCCSSLETVLCATRFYCEHVTLDPSLVWQFQWKE